MSTLAPSERSGAIGAIRATADSRAAASAGVRSRPRWWLEALAVAWLCWIYDAITNLAPLRLQLALHHARDVLALERTLHIAVEQTLDRWMAAHHALGLLVSDYYDNAHFIVTLGLLGWMWWRRPDIYRPARNALVLANVLAFLVFWRFPVAPPRMLPGFVDVVASTHAIGSWHAGALASAANQLAAMPSLHIAWAVWCTLVIWRVCVRRWVRALALAYPALTSFAVLATGNHFVMDVLGGLLTITASVLIVRAFSSRSWPWRAYAAPAQPPLDRPEGMRACAARAPEPNRRGARGRGPSAGTNTSVRFGIAPYAPSVNGGHRGSAEP